MAAYYFDIEAITENIERIWVKEGTLAIEGYGMSVLRGTYLDFWKWIYEEKEFRQDEMLTQIACYAANDEVRVNKKRLIEILRKYDEYALYDLVLPLSMYTEKPKFSYSNRRKIVAKQVERERKIYLNELKTFSHSFTKFSIETASAALFQKSTKEECQAYLRQIATGDLCRVFILYNPWQRDLVLESISARLQIFLLEDMKALVRSKQFKLSDCVESEHKIAQIIHMVKQNEFTKE
ncbi:MAG: hypothetical protein PUG54_04275 [Firmicutes bacterium]|nr:hypothetical protein [Bacillota bacterium]